VGGVSSNRLKETFGGLKKFLEKFPDVFLLGAEHPFNPFVFLRKHITQEDSDSIHRGIIPKLLLDKIEKFRKVCLVG
jgi:hypothetical protein